MRKGKIVIVDDNTVLLSSLKMILSREFQTVITLAIPTTLPAILQSNDTEIVLLDMNFVIGKQSGEEGLFWLDYILKREDPPAVILMTAYADIELAVSALKRGATDFIVKPWDNEKLLSVLYAAREKRLTGIASSKEEKDEYISIANDLLNYLLAKYTGMYGKPIPVLEEKARGKWLEMILNGDLELLEESIERTILLHDKNILESHISSIPGGPSQRVPTLSEVEKKFIEKVLKDNKSNLSTAASQLGISRQTLYNKIKKYNL